MRDDGQGVGLEHYFLRELSLLSAVAASGVGCVLQSLSLRRTPIALAQLVETFVGFAQKRNVVIEPFEIKQTVERQAAVVGDDVAQALMRRSLRAAHPRISGMILPLQAGPIENGDEMERHLIGECEGLLIIQGCSEMPDARPHRIFPRLVAVGIERFINGGIGLFNLRACGTLEIHMQVACQIPAKRKVTIPQELLIKGHRQWRRCGRIDVALLILIIIAREFGVECKILRQPIQAKTAHNIQPTRSIAQVLKRLPRLIDGRPGIAHGASPAVLVLINGGFSARMAMGMTIREREIGRIIGHRCA